MTPPHVAPIGTVLPPLYFNPGTVVMNGKVECSLWAIAYWEGQPLRYERLGLGAEWVRVG